jgi:hypothetical protein
MSDEQPAPTNPSEGAAPASGGAAPATVVESAPAPGTAAEPPQFDVAAWDGKVETLPEQHRPIAQAYIERKGRDLESGYTRKFQDLADERKKFEADKSGWEAKREELEETLRLYKALAEGADDPRLATTQKELETANAERKLLKEQFETLRKEYEAATQQADQAWLADYKQRHQTLYDDPAKRADLAALVDAGWEPEAAADLVELPDDVREAAAEIARTNKLGPERHRLAVEHARLRSGGPATSAAPRRTAVATAGAHRQANPSSVPGSMRDLPLHDARKEAARRGVAAAAALAKRTA